MVKLAKRQWVPVLLALLTAAGLGQWRGDSWEEPVRQALFRLRGDTIPSFATDYVDAAGIPYVYYAQENGIMPGFQYNATIVCNYALAYTDSLRRQPADTALRGKLQRCVRWLHQQLAGQGDTAIFYFHWQQAWYPQVGVPYSSGMTSGLAMQVLARADSLLGLPDAATTCRRLLRGFYVPRQQGGFAIRRPTGWWYEELADTAGPTPQILDGHIFALQGLQAARHLLPADSLATVWNNGLAALKAALPDYDAGNGRMYYDAQGKLADNKYRRTLTNQMAWLFAQTGDPFFEQYYRRWQAPLARPYVWRTVADANKSGLLLLALLATGAWLCISFLARVWPKSRQAR